MSTPSSNSLLGLRRLSKLDRSAVTFLIAYALFRGIIGAHESRFAVFLSIVALIAGVYLCFHLLSWVKGKVLWKLRDRLIVAYIFIAVIPVVLLLTMVALGMYLLYPQIGAHLLQDALQDHIGIVADDAEEIAIVVTQETEEGEPPADPALLLRPRVVSLMDAIRTERPGVIVALHEAATGSSTNGKGFSGLAEAGGKLMFAAEESREGPSGAISVFVGVPVTPGLLDRTASPLGPIQFTLMNPADSNSKGIKLGIDGHLYVAGEEIVSSNRDLPPAANWLDVEIDGAATLQAHHLDLKGERQQLSGAAAVPVLATFSLRPSSLNRSLLASVGAVGPILVGIVIVSGIVFFVLEIAALITGTMLTRTITRAIGDLYDGTLHVKRGDFKHRVAVHQKDQLGALGESFNEMTGSIANLVEEQRQRQRLEHEIAIASEVQHQLFPKSLPDVPGLRLAAVCKPARVVSGDYYDFIRLNSNAVGIAVADISGKGIFAALLMASLQAALRSRAAIEGNGETSKLVGELNEHLFKNTSDDRYATFFYATYDSQTQTLTYTNAGHLAPFFITDGHVQQLDQGGTVMGLFEDASYSQVTLAVPPGTVLIAFSDGVTEATNAEGEEFGVCRLRDEVLRWRDLGAQALMDSILAEVGKWVGNSEQSDDITVVVARMG